MNGDLLPNKLEPNQETEEEFDITSEGKIALVIRQEGKTKIQINLSNEEAASLLEDLRWAMEKVGIL